MGQQINSDISQNHASILEALLLENYILSFLTNTKKILCIKITWMEIKLILIEEF